MLLSDTSSGSWIAGKRSSKTLQIACLVLLRVRARNRPIVRVEDLLAREAPVGDGLLEHEFHLARRILSRLDERPVLGLDLGHESVHSGLGVGIEPRERAVEAQGARLDHARRDRSETLDIEIDGSPGLGRETFEGTR